MPDKHLTEEFNKDLSNLFETFEFCATAVVNRHLKSESEFEVRSEVFRVFIVHLVQMAVENMDGKEGIEAFIEHFGSTLRDCYSKSEFETVH